MAVSFGSHYMSFSVGKGVRQKNKKGLIKAVLISFWVKQRGKNPPHSIKRSNKTGYQYHSYIAPSLS